MPEAVPAAILFDHFQRLKFPAEQPHNIASSQIASIRSLGNVPVSMAAAEKGEFWAENGEDKKAAGGQDVQNSGFISRPIRLFLMMEATVVQNDIKCGLRSRQMKDIGDVKNDSFGPLYFGQTPSPF